MYALLMLAALAVQADVKKPEPPARRTRQLIVVAVDDLEAANAAAIAVWGRAGKDTFSVKFTDGKAKDKPDKATHYVCSLPATAAEMAAFSKALEGHISGGKVAVHAKVKGIAATDKLKELKLTPVTPAEKGI